MMPRERAGILKMPLMRYFVFVGGALLALLFVVGAYSPSPKSPVVAATATEIASPESSTLRIHSDRKWPDRIVFDTNIPTIVPALVAKTDASAPAPATIADVTAKVRVRESFAQFAPPETAKPESKVQRKRKIVRNRVAQPTRFAAQQPRFGFFGTNSW
jgi:hypothetical protein